MSSTFAHSRVQIKKGEKKIVKIKRRIEFTQHETGHGIDGTEHEGKRKKEMKAKEKTACLDNVF